MRKKIFIAIACALIGSVIGANTSRYFAAQHEKSTAVMVLMQLHQQQWEQAVQNKNCAAQQTALDSLKFLANEIAVVLPKADAQDAVFHQHVQNMQQVLTTPSLAQCSLTVAEVKQVRDACDECHREYR